ncbi:hypothetical protein SEA_CASEND_2 [Microbacterium phage Casend]|nr:hypothetical protein SEA_CASEND_2 [Microbacterium phage Casend]WNM75519.1 hypothetical protein SEA_WAYNE3_2 [Microbacterium phage Wayne3]
MNAVETVAVSALCAVIFVGSVWGSIALVRALRELREGSR